VKKEGGR